MTDFHPPSPICPQVLQFPVQMLIRFWVNHHLLDIFQRPLWRVVKGRSREYVNKVLQGGVGVELCWPHQSLSFSPFLFSFPGSHSRCTRPHLCDLH